MKLGGKVVAVIGLGYVGLPLSIELSKKYKVIGYDIDLKRIKDLRNGLDKTYEVQDNDLKHLVNINFTSKRDDIKPANIFIVTVPTPIDVNNKPNLKPLISASETVGKCIQNGDLIIYESTVYPGCTEELCVPILEEKSGLSYNKDFFCGYSPERINPSDKVRKLTNITKIVSGSNDEALKTVDMLYSGIIKAGTFKVSSIKVAEAAKVIENVQRDVNIALINEFALIFDKLEINTSEVLSAASTKWNFLKFYPGLVGGHCIGVDPYYLTHKAMEVGYHPEIILAGRKINDNVGYYIAQKTISKLVEHKINPSKAKVSILGLTFKEDCPDLRNSKVVTIYQELKKFNCDIIFTDSVADEIEAREKYEITLSSLEEIKKQDALIIAVSHKEYTELSLSDFSRMLKPSGIIIDVKSIFSKDFFVNSSICYWQL